MGRDDDSEKLAAQAPLCFRVGCTQLWIHLLGRIAASPVILVWFSRCRSARCGRTFRSRRHAGLFCEIFGVCAGERPAGVCGCRAYLFAAEMVVEFRRAKDGLDEDGRTLCRFWMCRCIEAICTAGAIAD